MTTGARMGCTGTRDVAEQTNNDFSTHKTKRRSGKGVFAITLNYKSPGASQSNYKVLTYTALYSDVMFTCSKNRNASLFQHTHTHTPDEGVKTDPCKSTRKTAAKPTQHTAPA